MNHDRRPTVARAVTRLAAVAVTAAAAVASVCPAAEAATKPASAAVTARAVGTSDQSLVLPGTREIAAYQRSLRAGRAAHPLACPADPGYSFWGLTPTTISAVRPVSGGPGVHMTIALQIGATATAQVGAMTQAGASAVIANASVTFNVSFAIALPVAVTYGGDWTVPLSAHLGWLYAGAMADRYAWASGRYVGCTWVTTAAGVMTAPYLMPHLWTVVV